MLLLILVFGALLRFYQISTTPPSLNWDEVSHGYNAYSILKIGRDEWGRFLPTIFRAYGDFKLPTYIYSSIFPIAVFGLNVFAVRFVSVVAGIVTILFTYKLVFELFYNDRNVKPLALMSAFLVAVEPWTLFLSRGAFEANLALALIVLGFYLLLSGLRHHGRLVMGSIFLGLSVWTYNSARVFVPVMLLAFGLIFAGDLKQVWKNKRVLAFSLVIIIILLGTMFLQLLNPEGSARFEWVSVFDQAFVNSVNEARNSSNVHPLVSRLIYNKATFGVPVIFQNWLSHYTPSFLFFKGGTHFQFSVPERGILSVYNLLFLYFGIGMSILKIYKKENLKTHLFLLVWLVLGTVASSITREAPHVLRSITMLPVPMIYIALGLVWFASKFKKRQLLVLAIYAGVIVSVTSNYMTDYLDSYRSDYSWSWQYGNEQMVDFVKQNYDDYAKIIITKKYGEPHEFILFHWPWDPEEYQKDDGKIRFFQTNWYWVDRFDKFYFVNDWEIVGVPEDPRSPTKFVLESREEEIDCGKIKCLLVTSPGNVPSGWRLLETVKFLNGQPAYEIYTNSVPMY
ncbi:glycosyltransferase family 39 protein [Patescibacteria group bacterium]